MKTLALAASVSLLAVTAANAQDWRATANRMSKPSTRRFSKTTRLS